MVTHSCQFSDLTILESTITASMLAVTYIMLYVLLDTSQEGIVALFYSLRSDCCPGFLAALKSFAMTVETIGSGLTQ